MEGAGSAWFLGPEEQLRVGQEPGAQHPASPLPRHEASDCGVHSRNQVLCHQKEKPSNDDETTPAGQGCCEDGEGTDASALGPKGSRRGARRRRPRVSPETPRAPEDGLG